MPADEKWTVYALRAKIEADAVTAITQAQIAAAAQGVEIGLYDASAGGWLYGSNHNRSLTKWVAPVWLTEPVLSDDLNADGVQAILTPGVPDERFYALLAIATPMLAVFQPFLTAAASAGLIEIIDGDAGQRLAGY